jgi:hypothetical protein
VGTATTAYFPNYFMPGENKLYLFLALRERSRPHSNPGETSLLHGQVARSGRIRFSLNTTAVESFYRTASSNDFFFLYPIWT